MPRQLFNHDWRFRLYLGAQPGGGWQMPDDTGWRQVELPHDWSIELDRAPDAPSGNAGGFFPMGSGWYLKRFDAPEDWRGKRVSVEFEGVYMNAEVWLNENYLGRHPYGYTTFFLDLTPWLAMGAENVLTVRVDNACQLNSRWYSGSGIYRPVWLWVTEPVHVAQWGVYVTTPEVSAEVATVMAHTTVENASERTEDVTLHTRLLAPDGAVCAEAEAYAGVPAGGAHEYSQALRVTAPQLWSPDTPALYRLETTVRAGDRVMDTAVTSCGIRSLHFSAERGFLLNGQPLLLKGGCVHHDNGVLGAASYPRAEERKVAIHKASGYNAIRCAHNPPAPAFLDACDRLGMLVIDEAFDCWRMAKNPYDYHTVFEDWWQRDLSSMVRRDRCHPSVIMWSIGNEVMERDGRSGGLEIARALAQAVRALDPTRPVTCAMCSTWDGKRTWEDTDPIYAQLGVGGYNYQWQHYVSDHERCPERVMAGTESFPLQAFENWRSVEDLPYVIGDFVWTSLDYLGESGIGRVYFEEKMTAFLGGYPWHQANCGDLDLCGFKRPQSFYRDILWSSGAPLYLAVHTPIPDGKTPHVTLWGWPDVWSNWTWPGHEGQPLNIEVYSACEQVELFLNGISLGTRPATAEEKHRALFEAVPYAAGELRAVGLVGGQPTAEVSLYTVGAPARLQLTADRPTLRAEAGDLCYVTAEVVDAAGLTHPAAENTILFSVQGPGTLLAVGNSNPTSTERYVGNQRSAYRGCCLAVVKAHGAPGEIRLRAQADGLDGAELVIHVA